MKENELQNSSIDLPSATDSGWLPVHESFYMVPLEECTAVVHGVRLYDLTGLPCKVRLTIQVYKLVPC